MLLGRDARERLEPVREVRGALLERPLLHCVGNLVGDVQIEGRAVVDDLAELLVRGLGEPLLHDGVRKEQASVLLCDLILGHASPFSRRCGFTVEYSTVPLFHSRCPRVKLAEPFGCFF